MEPKAYKPLYGEYLTIACIIKDQKSIYNMTERQFVDACMLYSNGSMNPQRASEIYQLLMEEAGLL
jgi:hypothetical protein